MLIVMNFIFRIIALRTSNEHKIVVNSELICSYTLSIDIIGMHNIFYIIIGLFQYSKVISESIVAVDFTNL